MRVSNGKVGVYNLGQLCVGHEGWELCGEGGVPLMSFLILLLGRFRYSGMVRLYEVY